MDLQKTLDQIQSQLNKRKADLDTQEAQLKQDAKKVGDTYEDLLKQKLFYETKIEELNAREKAIKSGEDEATRSQQLRDLSAKATQDMAKLRKEETDLAEKYGTVRLKEQEVAAREQAVSKREVEYKEKLRKEFQDEISKRLAGV